MDRPRAWTTWAWPWTGGQRERSKRMPKCIGSTLRSEGKCFRVICLFGRAALEMESIVEACFHIVLTCKSLIVQGVHTRRQYCFVCTCVLRCCVPASSDKFLCHSYLAAPPCVDTKHHVQNAPHRLKKAIAELIKARESARSSGTYHAASMLSPLPPSSVRKGDVSVMRKPLGRILVTVDIHETGGIEFEV